MSLFTSVSFLESDLSIVLYGEELTKSQPFFQSDYVICMKLKGGTVSPVSECLSTFK